MNLIMTPVEYGRERMNHAAVAGLEQFNNSVRPIYGSTKDGNPNHIGTCLFIEWGEQYYILTAAHILDWAEHTKLYVGTGGEFVEIKRIVEFRATRKSNSDRGKDHYDFAFIKLSEKILKGYESLEYITAKNMVPRDYHPGKNLHLALGYPNSKNKKYYRTSHSFVSQVMPYANWLTEAPDLCRRYRISSNTHLFLPYDKQSKDDTGVIVNSYSPIGASGGALIDMGGLSHSDNSEPRGKLAGLLIEYPKRDKVIIAVKIHIILDCIVRDSIEGM